MKTYYYIRSRVGGTVFTPAGRGSERFESLSDMVAAVTKMAIQATQAGDWSGAKSTWLCEGVEVVKVTKVTQENEEVLS
jgi:hypothetical protein